MGRDQATRNFFVLRSNRSFTGKKKTFSVGIPVEPKTVLQTLRK